VGLVGLVVEKGEEEVVGVELIQGLAVVVAPRLFLLSDERDIRADYSQLG